ncbi:MAG: hypothetical protein Q9165_004118 [Trypethelium subeluteriae]
MLPSMLSPSQPKGFLRGCQPPSIPFFVAEGPSTECNADVQTKGEPGQLAEEMSWKQGWNMIEEFFPEPTISTGLLTEEMEVEEVRKQCEQSKINITNLQNLKSSVLGSGTFRGAIAEHPKEKCEEQINPSTSPSQPNTPSRRATNAQIVSTGPVMYSKPTFLPFTNIQSPPREWPGRGAPNTESMPPALPTGGPNPLVWPSEPEIHPSIRHMYGARVDNVFAGRLPFSTPSVPTGAQQLESVITSHAETLSSAERESQMGLKKNKKKAAKKIPAESKNNKGPGYEMPTAGFGLLVPVPPKDSTSATAQRQAVGDGAQPAVDVSMIDNSQVSQLESETLHLNQDTIPPKFHAQKAIKPHQRKQQKKSATSTTPNLEGVEVARIASEVDKEHPAEDRPNPKRRARKPAQPRKKDVSSNAKADSSKVADVTAEIEVPEAAGMEVGDPAKPEAESMIPAAAKSEEGEKPNVKQGKAPRPRKKIIAGEKRKGLGMGTEVKAAGKSEQDSLATKAAARNKRAKVDRVGKPVQRKSARLSNTNNPSQDET